MYGRKPKTLEEKTLVDRCYAAGMNNGWASGNYAAMDGDYIVEADRLNRNSIQYIDDLTELQAFFDHGNWCLGQGVIYQNLFFLQQVSGGDEWATYAITDTAIDPFESISFQGIIQRSEFAGFLNRITAAGYEQLLKLEY